MEIVKLGILGMGTVASGLINIIEFNNTKVVAKLNKQLSVKKVLVNSLNKKRDVNLSQEVYTTDPYEVINDSEIKILVELIGGINPAYEYIKAALNNKKHVVTANKALIATHGEELEELASKNNVKLMYEASVAGGIPIINSIKESLQANEFESIFGIINGTTNYILTQMGENGLEYVDAVKEAQELGFAEADPSSDVEGDDAAYKISILGTIAFGQRINIKDVPKEGITKISKKDISYAKELGYNIKLLASALKGSDEINMGVAPALVPCDHLLSTVKNEFNAVFLKGNAVGELMFYGKGAGSLPTGSAVLGDVMSIVKNSKVENINYDETVSYKVVNNINNPYYIRFEISNDTDTENKISEILSQNNVIVSSSMKIENNGNVDLVVVTKEVERDNLDKALQKIKAESIIKIENFK